jgi:CRP/FNR family transcriptional regulator
MRSSTAPESAQIDGPLKATPFEEVDLRSRTPACSDCPNRNYCLPGELTPAAVRLLDDQMFSRLRVREGVALYHEGEAFKFFYAVRSGSFKSILTLRDGRDQVTDFHVLGELMGLDGVARGVYASTAVALEAAEVCIVPYARMEEVSKNSAELQQMVSRTMSMQIVRERSLVLLLGSMNSEERLASFLLSLSRRMKRRGYSPDEFHLRMSRVDLASYLALSVETVSRTFSAFQQQGFLRVNKKHVRILDHAGLQRTLDMRGVGSRDPGR